MDYEKRLKILENFNLYLKLKGFAMYSMPKDGNCMYHAIAASVNENLGDYVDIPYSEKIEAQMVIRLDIHDYLIKNPKEGISAEKVREILKDKCEGDNESIVVAAECYRRKIVIERPLEDPYIAGAEYGGIPIYLAHINENHYNALELLAERPVNDERVVQVYFEQYLKLKGYELYRMHRDGDNPFDALAEAFEDSYEAGAVRRKFREHLMSNMDRYKGGLLARIAEEGRNVSVEVYARDLFWKDHTPAGKDFVIQLATDVYRQAIEVFRPLEQAKAYLFEGGGRISPARLALRHDGTYDCLKPIDPNDEEEEVGDDDVVFIDYEEKERIQRLKIGVRCDPSELLFIKRNVYRNLRDAIYVVLLVPIRRLRYYTLHEVIREREVEYMKHLVVYSLSDLRKFQRDVDLRKDFTMYVRKYHGPFHKSMLGRLKQITSFILPSLFMTARRVTWRGISIDSMSKFSSQSFPIILLTHCWAEIKDVVKADVKKLLQHEDKLICRGCKPGCPLENMPWHFDAKKFHKLRYLTVSGTEVYDRFNLFATSRTRIPAVVKTIREVHAKGKSLDELYKSLDERPANPKKWHTYVVLHVDGPNMEKYKGDKNYYALINDPTTVKSIYVGVTTNSPFRYSHYVSTSSLNAVFTRTSRLFMLRSIKFNDRSLARRDEAIVIEILSTLLESLSRRNLKADFLLLNQHAQCMELLEDCVTNQSEIWASFATSDIPVFNKDPKDRKRYPHGVFLGNFQVNRELTVLCGAFRDRGFEDMEEVYALIRARQP